MKIGARAVIGRSTLKMRKLLLTRNSIIDMLFEYSKNGNRKDLKMQFNWYLWYLLIVH